MIKQHLSGKKSWMVVVVMLVFFICSMPVAVFCQPAAEYDIDDSDPVKLTSRIMEVHPEKGRLVVAEQEIWIVDFMFDGQQFKTALKNPDGDPISLENFAERQLVLVKGFKLPDGRIIASLVKQVNARQKSKFRRHSARIRKDRP